MKTRLREQLDKIAKAKHAATAAAAKEPEPSGAATDQEGEGTEGQDRPEV